MKPCLFKLKASLCLSRRYSALYTYTLPFTFIYCYLSLHSKLLLAQHTYYLHCNRGLYSPYICVGA
jgi:hypothetical protein